MTDYKALRRELEGMTVRKLRAYARGHLVSLADAPRKADMVRDIVDGIRHQEMTRGDGR